MRGVLSGLCGEILLPLLIPQCVDRLKVRMNGIELVSQDPLVCCWCRHVDNVNHSRQWKEYSKESYS